MPNPVSNTLGFNLRMDHWKDKRVRQAFAYAIDRKKIVDSLLGGNAELVNSPIRHAFVGYKPKNDYAYNPDKAKQLLAVGTPTARSWSAACRRIQKRSAPPAPPCSNSCRRSA